MKKIELKNLRSKKEKHFLQEDGKMIAQVFSENIHFLKNGKYEEVDNTLIKKDNYYTNKNNNYQAYFYDNDNYLVKVQKDDCYLKIKLKDNKATCIKEKEMIYYKNILNNIDFKYQLKSNKLKEEIILKDIEATKDKIIFDVETNLSLSLNAKKIYAYKGNQLYFVIDYPYMYDSNKNVNNDIYYTLIKNEQNYELELNLDEKWLKSVAKYPVVIDPTIITIEDEKINDTYIYPGDTGIDRNAEGIMKVGVERINGIDRINRGLIKFDLPTIGTGSQVVSANLILHLCPILGGSNEYYKVNVHRVTSSWNENDANWDNMSDKYDNMIEAVMNAHRGLSEETSNGISSTIEISVGNITKLVKSWYADTENNGMLLMVNEEEYQGDKFPVFYTKDDSSNIMYNNPYLEIEYLNQNGLEEYLDYEKTEFSHGSTFLNNYNGNLTTVFDIGYTNGTKCPANLKLIYNTNDVVLNHNIGYGLGYRTSLNQTIREVTIEEYKYLEFVDADGTLHYFYQQEGIYKDEDGLNLTITKTDDKYVLKDKENHCMNFIIRDSIGYLSEIVDASGNKINILLDENNSIKKIVDADNQEINILYDDNIISIISPNQTVNLNYSNNRLSSISYITGVTSFSYNDKNILKSITDECGLKLEYEYYDQIPYRMKKVVEYGLDNTEGRSYEVNYDNDSTTKIDNNNMVNTITFNRFGNAISVSTLKSIGDVKDAYGSVRNYGDYSEHTNNLLSANTPQGYVKNYISNSSFEGDSNSFTVSNETRSTITTECKVSGRNSVKITVPEGDNFLTREMTVAKGKFYTFSAYVKNDNEAKVFLSYKNSNGITIKEVSELIKNDGEFGRYDVTIFYPDEATTGLYFGLYFYSGGICYIDNIQLEEGEVANHYNYIDNSDFSKGLDDWTLSSWKIENGETINLSVEDKFEIATVENGLNALKIKMNPNYNTSCTYYIGESGKEGDDYYISFWYKNEGLVYDYYSSVNTVFLYFYNPAGDNVIPGTPIILNSNKNEWQFFSKHFTANQDFEGLFLGFSQMEDANNLYITNINMFKGVKERVYEYDDNGNVISSKELNDGITNFHYDKNNQLIQMLNPKGENFTFEYDNNSTDRITRGISGTGVSNEIIYDANGNAILTKITNTGKELENSLYKFRLKGTNKYLKNKNSGLVLEENNCNHNLWILEQIEENYKIKHSILNKYIIISNGFLTLGDDNDTQFILIKNNNGSFSIKDKNSDNYMKNYSDILVLSELIEDDCDFQFYFENLNDLFIENSAEYTSNGKFIKSTTDANFNKIIYDVDNVTGLNKSVTNPKKQTTYYEYDDKKRLKKILNNEKSIEYVYNANSMLEKIIEGNRVYNFSYDNFLKTKEIKIGDNIILVENHYGDNNGKLISSIYGNNHNINFEYDEFMRVSKVIKMNDAYNYKYGSNGDLLKVISNNDIVKYKYDLAKRLTEYNYNNFKIKYEYDQNHNVTNIQYKLDNIEHNIINNYNDDNSIVKMVLDNNEINYNYDYLNRIANRNINNNYITNYEYITNGKRTSLILKSVNNNNDLYSYKYDKLYNITSIYNNNNNLINKYCYDEYNQLIEENNYNLLQTIRYSYDNYGNLLSKKVYALNTFNLLSENKYEYNNLDWVDQLTKFNNEIITYDAIGNPLTIGNKSLMWINGRQLNSYNDGVNTITYKYDKDGIRISKTINGEETKYYLEGNKIIFEVRKEKSLYYIYNEVDDIIGLEYDGNVYYYVKNAQNDVIGILDSNFEQIVKYSYDSWGNILAIVDGEDNDISNNLNHIGNINPFRYRSYYYDAETNLYYLNSRYYNPIWGRFINADGIIGANNNILKYNLYAYCSNNPINAIDSTGESGLLGILGVGTATIVGTIMLVGAIVYSATKAIPAAGKVLSNLIYDAKTAVQDIFNSITNSNEDAKVETPAISVPITKDIDIGITPVKPCVEAERNPILNKVETGERLTINESVKQVLTSRSVLCDNRDAAEIVAKMAAEKEKKGYYEDRPHGGEGYYWHFHVNGIPYHPHIWYY